MIGPDSLPVLRRGVRLHYSEPRGAWVVQAPERVLIPDDIALAVLQRCDGKTSVAALAEALARDYDAPVETVSGDVVDMLQDLFRKGIVENAGG